MTLTDHDQTLLDVIWQLNLCLDADPTLLPPLALFSIGDAVDDLTDAMTNTPAIDAQLESPADWRPPPTTVELAHALAEQARRLTRVLPVASSQQRLAIAGVITELRQWTQDAITAASVTWPSEPDSYDPVARFRRANGVRLVEDSGER